jgi:signal transduction histidine kinase
MRVEASSSEEVCAATRCVERRALAESSASLRLRELLSTGRSLARAQSAPSRLIREFAADLEANGEFQSLLQGELPRNLLEQSLQALLPDILAGCCDMQSSELLTALGVHELLHFRAIVAMRWRLTLVLESSPEAGVLPEGPIGTSAPEEAPDAPLPSVSASASASVSASASASDFGDSEAERGEIVARHAEALAREMRDALRSLARDASLIGDRLADVPVRDRAELAPRATVFECETQRLAVLADHALVLGRCLRPKREPQPFRRLVEEVLRSQWPSLAEQGVELDLDLEVAGLELAVDGTQLSFALRGLVQNASDAMAGMRSKALLVRARLLDDGVELRVRDVGPGIVEPERAFDFFYTTKPYGTGLGLSVAREIARAHGGDLVVAKHCPLGAELLLTLPTSS